MSLVRLLTAGRSFVGLKESVNRYRETGQRLLPKFESKKNPFGTAKVLPGDSPEAEEAPTPSAAPAQVTPADGASAAPAAAATAVAPQLISSESRSSRFWRGCLAGLGVLRSWRPRRAVQPPARRLSKPMFQAELSLASVKVVRNDLTDSDVEIVTARTVTPADRPADVPAGVAAPAKGPRWARMTGRLFGAAKQ